MNVFPFIVLFHHILGAILAIYTLKFSTPTIFYRKFLSNNNLKLSPVLMYFFMYAIIWAILTLINKIYSIAFWRPIGNEYNAFLLYWIGFFPQNFGYLGAVLQIFLCIDRCATIIRGIQYSSTYQKYYSITTLLGIFIYALIFLGLNNSMIFGSSIPTSPMTTCQIFGCFIRDVPYFYYFLHSVVTLNALGGCILYLLIKLKLKSADPRNKRLCNAVIIIIATSTFSDIFPMLSSQFFKIVFGLRLNDIIGPFAITLTAANVTISTWLYSRTFRETFKISSINDVKDEAVPNALQ